MCDPVRAPSRSAPTPVAPMTLGAPRFSRLSLASAKRCDLRRSPGRILGNHLEDQFPYFLGELLSSDWPLRKREPASIQTEAGAMPTDDCLRGNNNQRAFPFRPHPLSGHPEQFLEQMEPCLACRRLNTASCCRRARLSSSRLRRAQNRRTIVPKQSRMVVNMTKI